MFHEILKMTGCHPYHRMMKYNLFRRDENKNMANLQKTAFFNTPKPDTRRIMQSLRSPGSSLAPGPLLRPHMQ